MKELQIAVPAAGPDLSSLLAKASQYLEAAKSPATRKAYKSDARSWEAFCAANALPFLPSSPEVVTLYISDLASRGIAVATIRRKLAAITDLHRSAGYADSPATPRRHYVLHEVLAGIKRTLGTTQHGADPLLGDEIRRIASACPANLLGTRDRSLILLGFSMGARRSMLASIIEVSDLTFTDQGLYVSIRHGKSERFEDGPRQIAVPFGEHPLTCPVLAVRAWIEAGNIRSGVLFRAVSRHGKVRATPLSPRSIAKILAKAVARAGIDTATAHISPHSLRAGMCTQAATNRAEERDIQRTTLHRSVAMVRRYVRDADLFRANAAARLGL